MDHVALDETVIQLDDQCYWLYAAVDPETNEFLHIKLYSMRITALTEIFLRELREKYDVEEAVFLIYSAPWLKAAHHHLGLRFRYEKHGNRNAVERLFQEIKRRASQFGNCFRNADLATAETMVAELRILLEPINLNNAPIHASKIHQFPPRSFR